jgi:hypothetical protein
MNGEGGSAGAGYLDKFQKTITLSTRVKQIKSDCAIPCSVSES